ncbi:pentapeptide repeat-containing protein [Haloarcula amylovorans]|uniref:pentapeptide repeat-containing protein n=1 Tax=Haloarcula amylovorans TaxID=2562280 RepID=UPI0010760602
MFSNLTLTIRLDEAYLQSLTVSEKHSEDFGVALSFTGCTMVDSNFAYSQLSSMSIKGVQLEGSTFEQADLSNTLIQQCTLNETNFKYAQLQGARLLRQNIRNSSWQGVKLKKTVRART